MSDPLIIVFISAGSAILATLLTIFLTPRLQHYFWKHQRLAERRLAIIDEINRLTANFMTDFVQDPRHRPDEEFYFCMARVAAELKILFSEGAWQLFKEMEAMIGPKLGPEGKHTVNDFILSRDKVLRSLYKEADFI